MRKAPLAMTYPQYVFIIVILAVLFLYCTFQACNRQCGRFFKDCMRCCCLEDDRQNSEHNSIPMNNLSPRPTPQVPSIVINRPNPKERESTPMYSMPRRMLPSSNRLQPLDSKIPASILQGKGENKSSNTNASYSGAKCETSSINTKNSRRSESHVDLNNNNFVDRVGNRKDGKINQGKHSLERNVTTDTQKDDAKPKIRQESQIKKNETPCTLKGTCNEYWKTSATGNPLNLGNNKSSENNEEPYYQNISGKPITRTTTCNVVNRMQTTSQGKLENRRIRGDSPVPNVKRRATNERRKQHLSRYIVQNDIGENIWPNYKKAKPFESYNNQEQLLQKGALCDCYRGPILKGIAKKGSLKLKPLPELEMVSFSEDTVEKDVEQSVSEEVMNPSVPYSGILSRQTKASVSNLNGERPITRKSQTAAGGTEENLQLKFIKNYINPSKPRRNEEAMNPSVLCCGDLGCKTKAPLWNLKGERSITSKREIEAGCTGDGLQFIVMNDTNPSKPQGNEEAMDPSVQCRGDLGCKTKAPLWNLNGGRSFNRKGEIAAGDIKENSQKRQIAVGSTKENSHFKFIKNDIKPSKPQSNEETINPSVLCGGDLCCKSKAPLWNLKGERSITSKGEIAAGGTEDGLQFIIMNDTNPSKPQSNEMVKGTAVKLPSVPLKRKQCTGIMIENTYSGRDIGSKNAKVNCSSKINCYDINSSIPHDNEMPKGMALKLPCLSLKRKQFIGNSNETESSGSDTVPKYANDICNLKNKCNFIKNEMGFSRIPAEETKDNISQRFPEEIQLRKSCKLHASDKKPYLIPNKYLKNKVSSNNFNVREHAGPSDPKFNLYSKKSSKELRNITMKSRSMGNELYGIDQIMEPRSMNVGNMHLGEPSVKSKNSNLSLYTSSFAEDKPRNWASMNITEKSTNKLEEKTTKKSTYNLKKAY
ncbi:hypothetical protein AVEN_156600-1 [Araneus ventricosus]|uniref:Uncharacterized protein n=1 Tax=Araneus ventricosus TaxID=182803 RepID=A0A4Y2EWE7_ARAVE|nr:hypothetical protein AVEN_156600-1 [Araneus ventricosus]